jgi:hypothetical protein
MGNLFKIKDDIILEDMMQWHESLLWIFSAVVRFCKKNNLELTITSLISDRKNVHSVSTTHEDGRAFDIRCSGGNWSKVWIHKLVYFLNANYSDWGAISKSTGKPLVALYHNNHIHIQVRPNCNMQAYIKEE